MFFCNVFIRRIVLLREKGSAGLELSEGPEMILFIKKLKWRGLLSRNMIEGKH